MILFFDTETTDLFDFKASLDEPHQPHLVQLAAVLMTLDQKVISSMSVVVQPEGWTIPEEAARIHGITQAFAEQYGVERRAVLRMFSYLCRSAKYSVAYNMEFDQNVVWAQFIREGVRAESFNATRALCAMKAAAFACKIPDPRRRSVDSYKYPTLTQAHQHLLGCPFDGAHDAMTDTLALSRVAFKLIETGFLSLPPVK